MHGWVHGWVHGCVDEWMNGRVDGWMDEGSKDIDWVVGDQSSDREEGSDP